MAYHTATAATGQHCLRVGAALLGFWICYASAQTAPAVTPAPASPVTVQRIDPIIAPVNRAKPVAPKIDPGVAASIKAQASQLANTVKSVPKQDALAAAKAALASAKVAVAKALAARQAPATNVAAKPTIAKTAVKAPAIRTAAKPVTTAPPATPAAMPAAKPL
jgi:hypothetical protein